MQLRPFVTPVRSVAVLDNLGRLLGLFGYLLMPALAVALLFRDFLHAGLLGAEILGCLAPRLALRRRPPSSLTVSEALVVTALAYLSFSLLGAVVFLPTASLVDGLFESMSGITTTGLSVMRPGALPGTLLFFRSYTQWIGGAGIVIVSLLLLLGPGLSAFRLFASERSEDNVAGDVKSTARKVVAIYVVLTALGFAAFWGAGMSGFHALLHVMSTVSTGGFSPHDAGLGAYSSPMVHLVVTVFMIGGSISFVTYHEIRQGRWQAAWRDPQLRVLMLLIGGATVVFFLAEGATTASLTTSLFHAASAVSTTGFGLTDGARWSEGTKLGAVLVMFVGGAAGSTAGGLKIFRLLVALHLLKRLVARALLPAEARLSLTYDRRVVGDDEIVGAAGVLVGYLLLTGGSALALTAGGVSYADAVFESTSALATVGLSVGVTSPALPAWAKLLLTLNMWAGRLEILPVLVLLYPPVWRRRRTAG